LDEATQMRTLAIPFPLPKFGRLFIIALWPL
jgi:hypothetical protein